MLTYDFSKRGNKSLYEYLYNCIRQDILSGKIKADEKLPSKREMAKNHNISVITVENAYAQLIVEGYIYTQEKKGYFAGNIQVNRSLEEPTVQQEESKREEKKWLVDFTSNHIMYDSFPFATWSKVMRQTLLDNENSFLLSPEHNGVKELREAIATHLRDYRGMVVNPNNIVVGAGTEYLYSLIIKLLGVNTRIAVEDPGYKKISQVYESNNAVCIHVPISKDADHIERIVKSDPDAVHVSPSHHFPTGMVMPIGQRHQLIQWAKSNNRYIIEDDYDSEFRFQGKPIPAMAGIDSSRVIYMNTFSKTLVPSIRIAYMVLPDRLMAKYNESLSFFSSTVSSFEQYTLANFIKHGYYERHINRMRNYYREYRHKIISAIKHSGIYNQVTIEEENSGLHFILGIKKKIDDKKFVKALQDRNINISCVSDYCYNDINEFKHKFIINYSAVDEKNLLEAIEIMNDILKG